MKQNNKLLEMCRGDLWSLALRRNRLKNYNNKNFKKILVKRLVFLYNNYELSKIMKLIFAHQERIQEVLRFHN